MTANMRAPLEKAGRMSDANVAVCRSRAPMGVLIAAAWSGLLASCAGGYLTGKAPDAAADLRPAGNPAPDPPDAAADSSPDGQAERYVWPADATRMVAKQLSAGFGPPFPPGSECEGQATYTLTVADRGLAWRVCRSSSPSTFEAPWRYVEGQRTLTTEEQGQLVQALRGVQVSQGIGCGTDKGGFSLTVTTPAATTEYLDSFYACRMPGNWVDLIDPVFETLGRLVP
jgi:hypothetical protein